MNPRFPRAVNRKIRSLWLMIPALFILISTAGRATAAPDTTWSVTFQVNMSKAVKDHVFLPDSDFVYMVADQGITPLKLVQGPNYVYSGTLYNELDSNTNYHYKYRINDSVWESVNRQVTTKPGMTTVSSWWNDEPVNYTNFFVNMQYAVQYGLFNPAVDSVTVVGTMNGWKGSPKMERMGTSWYYSYVYSLEPGAVHQYKYRINLGDTALQQLELLYKPNRMVRIPDTAILVESDFNNFNPGKRLMTFNCRMGYYIDTHRFDPASDFVDVAANFNATGMNDVLFDTNHDSVYTVELYLDTLFFHATPLKFKFRINGSQGPAELDGKPDREYTLHDTVGQNPNIFTCWFNDTDPTIPTPPWAYDLGIQGYLIHKQVVTGTYSYENVNGIPEDSTTYRWLRSFDSAGDSTVAIDTAWRINYQVDTLDIGKWLVFEVTPRAAYGDSAVGKPVRFVSPTPMGGVGIGESAPLVTRLYPNPSSGYITLEARRELQRVEIYDINGKTVMTATAIGSPAVRLQVSHLASGPYLVRATAKSGEQGVVRLVKE